MPRFANKAGFWGYRFLLATELLLVALLVMGGCYSKQNYHLMSPQSGAKRLDGCDVVAEGWIVSVRQWRRDSWQQNIFCYPLTSELPAGPDRYDLSIEIDQVLKGDLNTRRLQINNCRPLTAEEGTIVSPFSNSDTFPNHVRVKVGFNSQHGNSFNNLIIVPLGRVSTTQPNKTEKHFTPAAPAAR